MSYTVQRLRQNDPDNTTIGIFLQFEPSDAALAQALQQNPFITSITFHLDGVFRHEEADWQCLLPVLEMRDNLKQVFLSGSHHGFSGAALLPAFLQAIRRNACIRSLGLSSLFLPAAAVSSFIGSATSLSRLSIASSIMVGQSQGGTSDLVAALQRNSSIQTLWLSLVQNDIFVTSVLQSLRASTTLKTLHISTGLSTRRITGAVSSAIQQLLESTTTIARFEIGMEISASSRMNLPGPIAQGIIRSTSVSELKLLGFQFVEEESAAHFRNIINNKPNLTSLCLHSCVGGPIFREAVTSALGRPSSLLQCFEFLGHDCLTTYPDGQLEALLQVIKKSNMLERFAIGEIGSQQQMVLLTRGIPSMRVKELDICIGESLGRNVKESVLEAVKNNFSLRSVTGHVRGGANPRANCLFNKDGDQQRLAFFADRNERVDQWVENPEIVLDRKVWPDALNLAQREGPASLFRGLRSVFESEYLNTTGLLQGGRKRKRL